MYPLYPVRLDSSIGIGETEPPRRSTSPNTPLLEAEVEGDHGGAGEGGGFADVVGRDYSDQVHADDVDVG